MSTSEHKEETVLYGIVGEKLTSVGRRVPVDEPGVLLLLAFAFGAAGFARRGKVLGAALLAALAWPVAAQVPAPIVERYVDFVCCGACARVYWRGSHWERMRAMLDGILGTA